MMRVVRERTFQPSRALLPFSIGCLILIIFLAIQMLRSGPFLIVVAISPIIIYGIWWFSRLFFFCLKFSITVSQRGVTIERPVNLLLDSETLLFEWDEIKTVSFSIGQEINPKYFLFRNTALVISLKNDKAVTIDQVAVLDHYTDLFSMIQQVIPFVYEVPNEQLWDQRIRFGIVAAIACAFLSLFIVFLM